jgi:DNA repair protein RecN (Recombination protein N)
MLRELRIGNLALAEDLVLAFGPGLTMLTGETGAGKSLIAGALGLLAAGKADRDAIRQGEDLAFVEGVFDLGESPADRRFATSLGIRLGADDLLVLRRELRREGRGRVLVNGLTSSLVLLEQLGERLLAVQSQDQQRLLGRPSFPREFLDAVLDHRELRGAVEEALEVHRAATERLERRRLEVAQAREQLEMWSYQHRELDAAGLDPDEEADLAEKLALGRNARALLEAAGRARENLTEGPTNARQLLGAAEGVLGPLAADSPKVAAILALIRDAAAYVGEAASDLERFLDGVDADPARLDEMEERKALYEDLKRKYQRDVAGLVEKRDELGRRLARQQDAAGDLAHLEGEAAAAADRLTDAVLALRRSRQEGAPAVARRAAGLIRPLALPELELEFPVVARAAEDGLLEIEGVRCRVTARGADRVGLMVQPNPGEAAAEVGRIASGGEKSRIYLGLSVLAMGEGPRPLLLFDEIDAGLGMEGALPVADLLERLAGAGQVICITHLPTVAARGRDHLVVRKIVAGGRTSVAVAAVAGEARVAEIARLLGGEEADGADGGESRTAYARQLLGDGRRAAGSA